MNLLKRSIQRNGNGKLSNKTKKQILSVIFAGIMAGSSAVGMTGCELPEGFQNIADSFDVITVTGPNGEVVRTNANKVKKIIQDLPEMLKMAEDPTYVNENVEKIDSDTLAKLSAIYSLDYMIDGFGVFNEKNLNLLQQALQEQENVNYVTLPIPRELVGYNDMLYFIQVGKIIKKILHDDGSLSSETLAYNIRLLVPKSIETEKVGGKDLEYVTYYTCCEYNFNQSYDDENGNNFYYNYPTKSFYDLQKLIPYIKEGENEEITINYCEHTKPLFDAYFASLQDERVLEK